jgi:hypothetical protein
MSEVPLEQLLVGVKITLCHGLYDEVLIMREEEEASTLALGFTSLKDTVSVVLRTETVFDLRVIKAIDVSEISEDIRSKLSDFNILINDEDIIIISSK